MKYAFNLTIGEIVNVDDMITYFPPTLRIHRYICPECKKIVIPCVSDCISSYFKHKDESPDCGFYSGGEDDINAQKLPFDNLSFYAPNRIFQFIGFERFSLDGVNLNIEELAKIPNKFHPDFYFGEYILWIKTINELKFGNFDFNQFINQVFIFSKHFRPILFIINPDFNILEYKTPHPVIKSLDELYKSVIFEVPEKCSLLIEKVKVWLINSVGRIECPGRASIYTLIKKTRFSYKLLRKFLDEDNSFLTVEPKEYSDPEHTFRNELLELRINCNNCSREHILPIVINLNDELLVYKTHKNRTFSDLKNLYKFRCKFCESYFFTYNQMQEAWVNAQVTKKKESIQIELINFLKEKLDDDLFENIQQRQNVLIIQGDYIGKMGIINKIEGKVLIVRLVDSNETINISEDFILNL